jgi:DNA adenine methylase
MATSVKSSGAEEPIKPFLRWAGSKRKLLARLTPFWQPNYHERYIEPFAGSACLFFEIRPHVAILGDNNRELVDTYRMVKAAPRRVYRRLSRIGRDADTYYQWRKRDTSGDDATTRATRFIYLNRNCFNGIYRTNRDGGFNVPFGGKNGQPLGNLERDEFLKAASQLRRATFVAGDFSKTLELARPGDFVYLDPPFAVSGRRVFRQYGEKPFDTDDVERLARQLRRLDRIGAEFLVSYADCVEARDLAREWNSSKLFVRRNVAGFSGHRRLAGEWLITNIDRAINQ